MKDLIKEFSKILYEQDFKNDFKEQEWKIAYSTKELDGIKQEIFSIGARFEEIFWGNVESNRKSFIVEITKETNEIGGEVYFTRVEENKTTKGFKEKTEMKNLFINFLKEKGEDVLVYNPYDKHATGENSKRILKIIKTISSHPKRGDFFETDQEFTLKFVIPKYKILPNTKERIIKIFMQNEEVATLKNTSDVEKWIKKESEDGEKIHEFREKMIQLLKDKTKITGIRDVRGCMIQISGRNSVAFEIRKTFIGKKEKFVLLFEDKKSTLSTLDKAKQKAEELITDFAHKIRIRKLVSIK